MRSLVIFFVGVILVTIIQRLEAGWLGERNEVEDFKGEGGFVLEEFTPEPISNGLCHCLNSTCTCCIKEFKAKICTIITILGVQKVDEDLALLEFSLTINGRPVLTHEFPSDMIPPLCYHSMSGLGICGKIITKKEKEEFLLCSAIQLVYHERVFKEVDLKCRVIQSYHTIETTHIPAFVEEDSELRLFG